MGIVLRDTKVYIDMTNVYDNISHTRALGKIDHGSDIRCSFSILCTDTFNILNKVKKIPGQLNGAQQILCTDQHYKK